ncbi:MAG: family 78 glycoside hydrolase catalytic domain [Massilibacteroides sp.]|nr:family 78 glycoside hydrolase catalytic domain [Massilibacteroides sp.]MDD3061941.1 family 78 glycoside hydrolase catalytic domain [Massilibacteroides sp.]MDD4115265.1 family 78 glycoside hydrolase catalytic domain [Massilibacteroides sp.]MDD4659930.1 family 78 glycoside hydrolase catalytic domain [Massilibacteroides sp.]
MAGCTSVSEKGKINLVDLRVEMQENPEGLGVINPRFSWKLVSEQQDILQSAYQLDVATSEQGLNTDSDLLWTSGKMDSGQSLLVAYAGKPLESGKKYFWRLTVWTNMGNICKSDVQYWSMGLLNDSDWKAQWIGLNDTSLLRVENNRTILPARYLRKEFTSKSQPERAVLYVSGVGSSVCFVNGKPVGKEVFGPLPTWYDASVSYLTYDVTSLLKKGENAIGVVLGNGRFLTMREKGMYGFGMPRLIAQLRIEYKNGESELIVSDDSWKATNKGPITENNEFDGEKYDARLDLGKWTEIKYDDSSWMKAELMDEPKGKLIAQRSPSLRVMEEIKPLSVKAVEGGRYIVDMGQNMVGWLQVRLKGKKEIPVVMRFAEVLQANQTDLYVDNLRQAQAQDRYIPVADGTFTWEPTFVYHGFRFAEISGLDYEPTIEDFTGKVIYDNLRTIGSFETSSSVINQIYKNAYWGIRGNYRGMPTDCPQRDERLGWLGDRSTGAYGESFIFNNALLYNKWLVDIEESMNENSSISVVSPRYWTIYNDDVTWPSAYFYIADMLYRQFGDDQSIKSRYPSMKRWVQHMVDTQMKDYILLKDTYGDWCMPPESPELIHSKDPSRKTNGEVLSTTVFYSILQLMQKFAVMNDLPIDAEEYAALAAKVKEAYNKKFFNAETGQYDNNTVTANILSLQLGLVPEGYEDKVFANIMEKTEIDCKSHVSTGVLGIQHLMRGLTEHGGLELAYKIVTNETYPSWGYMAKNGATTIWELWNGDTADPAMNSRNHVMLLGDLVIWFYEDLAGIKNDPSAVGFKKIWMEPVFPEKLTYVSASYESPYGLIVSDWKRDGDRLSWNIEIPANTTATIRLPERFGVKAEKLSDVRDVNRTDGFVKFELGSGKYTLQSE